MMTSAAVSSSNDSSGKEKEFNDNSSSKMTKSSITITKNNYSAAGTSSSNNGGSNGSLFNEENYLKKLDNVTPTQDSIQSLALWIIHHKSNHEILCKLWSKKFNESDLNSKKRLALFYLANDVIQNCKRKNAKIFQDTFKQHLYEAIALSKNDEINKKNIDRVLQVWIERGVYEKEFVDKLHKLLNSQSNHVSTSKIPSSLTHSPAKNSPKIVVAPKTEQNKEDIEQIIAEFQPKKLCESISIFQSLLKDISLSKSNLEATRVLDINNEQIKQYRDKNQCAKFKLEFENSCLKLEEYTKKLQNQSIQRKLLIQLMEQAEIFYDAQFKDAKMVHNVYRIYGGKVHNVKKKLDELINDKFNPNNKDKFDQLDMDIDSDDDSNNHSNTIPNKFSNTANSLMNMITSGGGKNSSNSGSIKTHLDPRQNRHNNNHSSSKKSDSTSSSSSKRKSHQDESDQYYKKENKSSSSSRDSNKNRRSTTPVRDEIVSSSALLNTITNSISSANNSNNNNPLDFLTKFINKSSNQQSQNITANSSQTTSSSASSSSNLSFLVNSLQQFVNNPSSTSNSNQSTTANQPYFDPNNQHTYQSSYMQSDGTVLDPLRSVTPTKDEMFQQITTQPPPTAPYNHINYMVQPPPPHPPGYHQMYHAPTPPIGIPPLIDPNSYHPSYMPYNQPPPPIHGFPHYMPPPPTSIGQMPPTPQKSLPSPTNQTTPSKHQSESIKSNIKNNDQSSFKRKYGFEDDNNYNHNNNNNSNNKYQNNKNTNNRIPTINSQRDRGNSNPSNNNNNNDMSYNNNNNLNRSNSKSYHRY